MERSQKMQAIPITAVTVKKKSQKRRGQVRGSQTMVHGRKPSHYKELSQKRKRMTFLYHESREQTGRSSPGRKSEHNQVGAQKH